MKHIKLFEEFHQETDKILEWGIYLPYSDIGAILKCLKHTDGDEKLIDIIQQYIDSRRKGDIEEIYGDEMGKIIKTNIKEIYNSLKQIKDERKKKASGFDDMHFDKLFDKIESIYTGKADLVDAS